MTPHNPKQIAESGERIYREKFQEEFERVNAGKFAAIDIDSETAYVGDTATEAIREAQQKVPNGKFHLVRVGSPGAFRIGYSSGPQNGGIDWIFR